MGKTKTTNLQMCQDKKWFATIHPKDRPDLLNGMPPGQA